MKIKSIWIAFLCACCFSEEAVGGGSSEGTSGESSEGGESSTTGSTTIVPGSEESESSESASSDSSVSDLGSDSDSSSESTGEAPHFCSFSGAPCMSDEDCGIQGICYAPGQSCLHWCESDDDCPDTLYCFYSAELNNSHCAGCVGDDDKCAGDSMCVDDVTCAVQPYAKCVENNQPCTISDSCV